MKSYTASTIFFIALLAAPPAVWANTIINGTMLEGSLETQWITDYGPQASQSFHPTVGSPGDGATNPSIADSSNLFANETVAVSLGPLHGTSGAVTVFVPGGDITGKLWHLRTVFETPFGIGMGENFFATIYVSGASSNMLYYGMRVSGSVTGGAVATFTTVSPPDSPDIVVTDSNFSFDQFGSSHLFTWLGDTPDYSTDGNGFVGFNFQANNSGLSAGTPRTTYDVWLQLSNTPLTTMTSVPEPGEWALLLMGGLALLGPMRRRGRLSAQPPEQGADSTDVGSPRRTPGPQPPPQAGKVRLSCYGDTLPSLQLQEKMPLTKSDFGDRKRIAPPPPATHLQPLSLTPFGPVPELLRFRRLR